jgi:DNA-binding GntR family transcriptional regulator
VKTSSKRNVVASAPAPMLIMRGAIADPIFDTIKDRILEGELKPGTKLSEEEIASIFNVGRARARQSLRLLAAIGIVTIHANRGAFVASPTRAESAQIYAARRMLECPAVAYVAESRSSDNLSVLRAQLDHQRGAVSKNDRSAFLRATLEFHSLLASMAGNPVVEMLINQLLARAALISTLYEAAAPSNQAVDDHAGLVKLIASRDASAASKFMESHLKRVETWLEIEPEAEVEADLRNLLRRR